MASPIPVQRLIHIVIINWLIVAIESTAASNYNNSIIVIVDHRIAAIAYFDFKSACLTNTAAWPPAIASVVSISSIIPLHCTAHPLDLNHHLFLVVSMPLNGLSQLLPHLHFLTN